GRAVGDDQFQGFKRQERGNDSARRPTRTDDENAATRDDYVEVIAEVSHQACAVGVVSQEAAVTLKSQRVDGLRTRGTGRQFVCNFDGGDLVRQSHIQTTPAALKKLYDALAKFLGSEVVQAIHHRLPCLLGKDAVDEG